MRMERIFLALILCLTVISISFAQTEKPHFVSTEELAAELKAAPCKNSQRSDAARAVFVSMGANDSDISLMTEGNAKDIVVTKKGGTSETVIVGAHYDKVDLGCGAIDNWTGIVTIANIYRAIRDIPTDKTYLFVAFDKEESGLVGSGAFVRSIPKELRTNYCWMINVDSFGFSPPQVMDNTTTTKMFEAAETVAKDAGFTLHHAAITGADADSSSFKGKGIPSITFHGLNQNWQRYLHTSSDKFENINVPMVLQAYSFVLSYLVKIDTLGCSEFRK